MPTTIVMPQLGESVAEGVIGKWLKNEGDPIEKDEPIVEVITDKVNAEIPSPVAGTLEQIVQPEGATVAVGQPIAVIAQAGEQGGQQPATAGATASAAPSGTSRAGSSTSGGNGQQPAAAAPRPASSDGGGGSPVATATSVGTERGERVRSSPLVRRLAEQYGINLTEVPGTGIGGRVSKQDILSFVEQRQKQGEIAPAAQPQVQPQPATAVAAPPEAPSGSAPAPVITPPQPAPQPARRPGGNEELMPISPLRKMIADRMVKSIYTIPHATTMAEVDVTPVVRYREAKKDEFRRRTSVPLSYVAFVIKATVEALTEFPMVNAEWADDNIILKKDININVAVDAPEGLTTPVIHHADEKSLAGLSRAIYDLAMRARDKKLTIDDMQGGTFTVNNTGAIGSISGVSIINYPQGGILSSGAIVKRPKVLEQDGEDFIAVRSMMNVSLSFDHRLLDGGYAAGFVSAIKQKLEAWPMEYPLY